MMQIFRCEMALLELEPIAIELPNLSWSHWASRSRSWTPPACDLSSDICTYTCSDFSLARMMSSLRDPVRGPLRTASDRVSGETKKAVRRVLPGWAWYAYMRASGYLPTPIDAAPLERIARADPERLADGEYLAEEVLPAMGLN